MPSSRLTKASVDRFSIFELRFSFLQCTQMPNRFVVGQFCGGYRSIFHLKCMYVMCILFFFLINKKINAFLKNLDLKKP